MNLPWHLYMMALLYFLAGINHFRTPRLYQKIIPPYFSNPILLNQLSGGIEIILAIALVIIPNSSFAAWGIILLLLAVFPTHIYMLKNPNASLGLPKSFLYMRLPLQLLLMYWAYQYI